MPGLPAPTVRLVVRGDIDAAQGWSFGMTFRTTDGGVLAADLQQWHTLARTPLAALVTSLKGTLWDTSTRQLGSGAYFYPAGATVSQYADDFVLGTAQTGTVNNPVPRQLAVVASLRSDFSGRSRRGRIYIPCTGMTFGGKGQLTTGNTSGIAGFMKTFYDAMLAISTWPTRLTGAQPTVASFTKGYTSDITSVIVDSKVDTQRRRLDNEAAAFISSVSIP